LSSARGALRRASSLALHGAVILPEPTAMVPWTKKIWFIFPMGNPLRMGCLKQIPVRKRLLRGPEF